MKYSELPNDLVLEKGIFGLILFMPDKFSEISDLLVPNDFFTPSHQQIWQAMQDLFKNGQEVDLPSLRMQLSKQDAEPHEALEALAEAMKEEIRDYHLDAYVKEVKNKSLLRQIIKMSKAHASTGQLVSTNAQTLLGEMEKDLLAIIDKTVETRPVDAKGIIKDVQSDIEKGMKNGWKGFLTGFEKLDTHTGGFIPSQVWIVGAYTGTGKTFLMLQMILNVLRQEGSRVILFSTEMDRKLNMLRLIGNIAELGTIQMMRNQLDPIQSERMQAAKEEMERYGDRLLIYDNVYTVDEIRLKTKKAQLAQGVNLIVVDYIQNIRGGETIYERMSEAVTELYRMAQELGVTIVIGSQVSQASAGYKSKEAIEFKGAGEIAAVSDVALWIKKLEGNDRELLLRKVRHGKAGQMFAELQFPSGRFVSTGAPKVGTAKGVLTEQLEE